MQHYLQRLRMVFIAAPLSSQAQALGIVLIDFSKVRSLEGTYIATVLPATGSGFLRSLITWDRCAEWNAVRTQEAVDGTVSVIYQSLMIPPLITILV